MFNIEEGRGFFVFSHVNLISLNFPEEGVSGPSRQPSRSAHGLTKSFFFGRGWVGQDDLQIKSAIK